MLKITWLAISQKPVNQNKKVHPSYIFYTFLQILIATEIQQLFQHLENRHLKAKQMAQQWCIKKSKIGQVEHHRLHLDAIPQ